MALNNARNKSSRIKRGQRGVTLFETLLTVGVAAVFFVFLVNIGRSIARDQAVTTAASYVQQINEGVDVMLNNPANFRTLYNALLGVGNIGQITVNQLINGTGLVDPWPANPVLVGNFPTPGPFNQTYVIIFRIADNPAITTDNQVIETYIASQTMVEDDLVVRISAALEGRGGGLRDTANTAGGTIRSAFGGWTSLMATLAATNWYGVVTTAAAPTINNGGYVVSYNYYDFQRVAKDYLYRNDMGDRNLNTMRENVALSNYNIIGADNVTTSGTWTGREMQVQGSTGTQLNGAATFQGNLQSDGPVNVTTVNEAAGAAGVSLSATGGTFTTNALTTRRSVFSNNFTTNTINATGSAIAENARIAGGVLDATNSAGINASASGSAFRPTNADIGTLKSSNLHASDMTVSQGDTATVFMQTGTISQGSTTSTTQTRTLSGRGTSRVADQDWRCVSGCGQY